MSSPWLTKFEPTHALQFSCVLILQRHYPWREVMKKMTRLPTSIVFVVGVLTVCPVYAQVGLETGLWKWTTPQPHHESVVEVLTPTGNGTGVVIAICEDKPFKQGHEGFVLTAWHVIQDHIKSREIKVGYRNGKRAAGCKVVQYDKEMDIALLWVWVPQSVAAAKLASQPICHGTSIEFAGLGGGSNLKDNLRHFSGVASSPSNHQKIFADVSLLPGDSGGPVFNDQNEVVGIISGGWFWWDGGVVATTTKSHVPTTWPARACNVSPIHKLLEKNKVQHVAVQPEIQLDPVTKNR